MDGPVFREWSSRERGRITNSTRERPVEVSVDIAMTLEFPTPVPEIPVADIAAAAAYYQNHFGFSLDWGGQEIGLAGISRGRCRMFLADQEVRKPFGNVGPVMTWLNLDSNEEVDELYREWRASSARLLSSPESKPWGLHEFTAADLDGNLFRVFHDFATPIRTTSLAFTKAHREGIRRGDIRCGVRIWTGPRVKVGDKYPVDDGDVVVDSVEETSLENVTEDLARESGFANAASLRDIAKPDAGERLYLIRFHYVPLSGAAPARK
jgi:uncharacterized glyoxalase superfamily protein PhnB